MTRWQCVRCGRRLRLNSGEPGRRVCCPSCGQSQAVGEAAPVGDAPPSLWPLLWTTGRCALLTIPGLVLLAIFSHNNQPTPLLVGAAIASGVPGLFLLVCLLLLATQVWRRARGMPAFATVPEQADAPAPIRPSPCPFCGNQSPDAAHTFDVTDYLLWVGAKNKQLRDVPCCKSCWRAYNRATALWLALYGVCVLALTAVVFAVLGGELPNPLHAYPWGGRLVLLALLFASPLVAALLANVTPFPYKRRLRAWQRLYR